MARFEDTRMGRIAGATNVTPFGQRASIETSANQEIRHLSNIIGNPLSEFEGLLTHQSNYLAWLDKRHEKVKQLQVENNNLKGVVAAQGPLGTKEGTYVKYRWYAEELILLEAINAFENFYKKSFVGLGNILQEYVEPSKFPREISIEPRLIWDVATNATASELMFGSGLFHRLETIDDCSKMLIANIRYTKQNNPDALKRRSKSLRAIFQIRHTLSHNSGRVTAADRAKFLRLGFQIDSEKVIDPSKNKLAISIFKELRTEAREYAEWLAKGTAGYLTQQINSFGVVVPTAKHDKLTTLLGNYPCWGTVNWT